MSTAATCSEPDCDRPARTRGLCNKDYIKLRRQGKLPNLPKVKPTVCAVEGCDRKPYRRDLCAHPHYFNWMHHGDPLYRKPDLELTCQQCGQVFQRKAATTGPTPVFCGLQCY